MAAVFAAGCSGPSDPAGVPVATVADRPVTAAVFDAYVLQRTGVVAASVAPERKAQLLEELLRLEAAAEIGLLRHGPESASRAELARLESLAHSAAEAAGVFAAPTDAELQQAYQRFLASQPSLEYHAAHILVPTEAQAATILARLARGEDFPAVAASESIDRSPGEGGDLGWIRPDGLPAAFIDAVKALAVGAYTPQPVKTPFGWHIIRLLETRAATPPRFDDIKAQLAVTIQQERYARFLSNSTKAVRIVRQ